MSGLFIDDELRILDPSRRDLEPVEGSRSFVPFEVRGVNPQNRTVTALVSTPNVDRYDEIILPEAFKKWLPTFMKNPVLLAGHASRGESGEPTVIGHWIDLDITREGLVGTCRFLEGDELAEKWWQRFVQKAVRAFSVGFICVQHEMRDVEMPDGRVRRLRVHTEVELVEISAVAIPANRESLVKSLMARNGATDDLDDDAGEEAGGISNRRLNKIIARSMRKVVRDEIERALSAEPGSAVGLLIEAAVECALSGGSRHSSPVDDDGRLNLRGAGLDESDDAYWRGIESFEGEVDSLSEVEELLQEG